jgi:hypothetical protein
MQRWSRKPHGIALTLQSSIIFIFLHFSVMNAQSVVYPGNGADDRPTAITGIVINGQTYDGMITYSATGTYANFISPFPTAQIDAVAQEIRNILNTVNPKITNTTRIRIISNEDNPFNARYIVTSSGTSIWGAPTRVTLGHADNVTTNQLQGYLQLQLANPIPTISQWGLIIFGLLVLNLGLVFVYKKQLITTEASIPATYIPFNRLAFSKYFIIALSIIGVAFIIAMTLFGYELMTFDVPGSVLTAGLIAYLTQLLKH